MHKKKVKQPVNILFLLTNTSYWKRRGKKGKAQEHSKYTGAIQQIKT